MENPIAPQPPVTTMASFQASQEAQKTTFERLLQADTDLRQLINELDLLDGSQVSPGTDVSDLGLRALIVDVADLVAIATSRVVELRADLKQL